MADIELRKSWHKNILADEKVSLIGRPIGDNGSGEIPMKSPGLHELWKFIYLIDHMNTMWIHMNR